MYHYLEAIIDAATGATRIGYYARVLNAQTGSSAPIFADSNGTPIAAVSGLANAAKTDGDGNLSFFVEPGTYHLDLYDTDGETFIRRFSEIPMTSTQGEQGSPGPEGPPGPSNNTRVSLAALKGAATSDLTSIYNGYLWVWTPGDFSDVPASQIDRTVVQSDSAPLSVGAWRRQDGALYAGNFGIIGDGVTDETATVQAFLDLCEALGGRDAYFGGMMVRTTGPLTAHNVAIYFDPVQLTAGFRPLGSGYTVLTVTGTVTGGSISVIGYGEPELDVNGNPIPATPDNRPALNGIAFGAQDGSEPLSLSTINSVRVYGFAGSGIINTTVWDCTFLNTSVQYCGTATSPAFASTSPGGKTVNESNWIRLQVEESVGQAIYIAPDTLNCTYGLIHGERNWGVPGVDTWFLSGTGSVFESVRLQAHVPANATARLHSDNMTITNLRPEGELTVYVKPLLNGSISIISPTANAQLTADPTSQGKVTVIGGVYSAIDVRGGWSMVGGDIFYLQPGNMGADELADVVGARVRNLTTSPLSTNGNIQLTATNVDALTTIDLARIWLVGRSRAVLADGANVLANLFVHIDATSTLVGNVTLDTCGLKLGGVIEGDLTIGANRQVLASDTAYVTGTVTNDGPPEADNYLGEFSRGMRHKSLAPAAGQPTGWIYDGSAWLAEAPLPVPTP